jgi:transposase
MIASYETRLLEELAALAPADRRDDPPPPHPNPSKQRAITARGNEEARTTLWRFCGVDLTRIDGLSVGAVRVILAAIDPNLSAFHSEKDFVSCCGSVPGPPSRGAIR